MRDILAGGIGVLGFLLLVMGLTGQYGTFASWIHLPLPGVESTKALGSWTATSTQPGLPIGNQGWVPL